MVCRLLRRHRLIREGRKKFRCPRHGWACAWSVALVQWMQREKQWDDWCSGRSSRSGLLHRGLRPCRLAFAQSWWILQDGRLRRSRCDPSQEIHSESHGGGDSCCIQEGDGNLWKPPDQSSFRKWKQLSTQLWSPRKLPETSNWS